MKTFCIVDENDKLIEPSLTGLTEAQAERELNLCISRGAEDAYIGED